MDGVYIFPSPPSLTSGQMYRVGFGPNQAPAGNPNYVYRWYGPDITAYTAGTAAPGGSNDIANIQLRSPSADTTVSLPAQFEWQRRGLHPEDYQLVLFSPSTQWKTPLLGDVGSYPLLGLPPGFSPGVRYGWYVDAYTSADGHVRSYYYRGITFSAGTALPVGSPPALQQSNLHEDPMGSVPSGER
jgi:hypothetical protein